jgi:hypothetical protein
MIDYFLKIVKNEVCMERISEEFQDILLEDIKNNPELITELLLKDQDVSVVLEKHGDTVRFAYLRTYDKETVRILKEAKNEYAQKKEEGYTKEQAFKDLIEVQDEINRQL